VGGGWPSLATQAIGEGNLPAGSIWEYRELEAVLARRPLRVGLDFPSCTAGRTRS
jgi:hypothetical protein